MPVCTKCGAAVPSLYNELPNGLIKMFTCAKCSQIADKYIEYDLVIIMIDVFLMRKEAYRHILFNSDFKIRRTIFLLIIAEAYCKWVLDEHFISSRQANSSNEKSFFGSKSPLYFRAPGEWRFYYWFLLSSIESFSCFIFALLLLCLVQKRHFEAFVLGHFVKILSLSILVWLPTQQSQPYLFIISMLAAYSLFTSYSVIYEGCRTVFIAISVMVTFMFPFVICPIADDSLRPILFGGEFED